ELAGKLFDFFSCTRIVVAMREHAGREAQVWTAQTAYGEARLRVHGASLDRLSREALFSPAPTCWHAHRRGKRDGGGQFEVVYAGQTAEFVNHMWSGFPRRALDVLRPAQSCVAATFEFGPEWTCRLFVIDPKLKRPRQTVLRLSQDLVEALAPALYNVYAAERLRASAA